jgi:hypothetical protein
MKSKLDKFLEELSALTKKYGIEIGGCGCCDSPYLVSRHEGTDYIIGTDLCYNAFEEAYTVDI